MDLKIAHRFFSGRMYNITRGIYFQGQLTPQPLTENTGYFLLGRRMLKLDYDSLTMGGEVVRTVSGKTYITEAHSTSEFFDEGLYKTLRMYEVTDVVGATRPVTKQDPVLGRVVADGTPQNLPTVYAAIEATSLENDSLHTLDKVYRILTPSVLQNDDVVDGKYKVTNAEYRGGLNFYTARHL